MCGWLWSGGATRIGGGEKWGTTPEGKGPKRLVWRLVGKSLLCSQSRLLSPCSQGSSRFPTLNLSKRPYRTILLFVTRVLQRMGDNEC